MDCLMYASTHRSFSMCVCLCVCQKRCLTAHIGKTQTVVTMATNRKQCASFYAAEPGHPDNSLFPPVWPLHSLADSWIAAKSGLKELRNLRSSVYFSLLVLGLFTTLCEGCKWAQQSELCHHISLHLAKPQCRVPSSPHACTAITMLLGPACVGPT